MRKESDIDILYDKIAGAVCGFAIGDAMGATTEFMSENQINKTYGKVTDIIGGGWLNLKPGQVTDDTQMMICVMDAWIKYPDNTQRFKRACANNFVEWYKTNPIDVGAQCAKGIQSIMNGECIDEDKEALGNGSLMRALPCALVGNIPFNIHQGMLTHNNQMCGEIILEYSQLIQNFLNGNYIVKDTKLIMEPSGYIVNTFNNAVYWSTNYLFEDAIIGAVNHGGDADTIAAITGSLAGAKWGFKNIPKNWVNQLAPDIKILLKKFIYFAKTYVQTKSNVV